MKDDIDLAARGLGLMRRWESGVMSIGHDKDPDRHD